MQERDIHIQIQTHVNFPFIAPCDALSMWLHRGCPLQTLCPLFGKTNFPLTGSRPGAVAQTKPGSVTETQTRGASGPPFLCAQTHPPAASGHVQSSA